MSVRRFRILNKNNKYLDLLDLDVFAHNPEGLGIDIDHNFYQAFNTYADVAQASKQPEITLDIIFGYISEQAYTKFNDMLYFLNVGGLKLEYTVPGVGVFLRDVSIGSLTKTDIDEYGVLQEKLKLIGTSPWYSWIPLTTPFVPLIDAGIIYDDTVGLQYEHKAYAWSADGSKNFSRRFPNINLLKNTDTRVTFKGKGGAIPSNYGQGANNASAEVINVYDHPLIKHAIQVVSKANTTTTLGIRTDYSITGDGIFFDDDSFIQSYWIRNDSAAHELHIPDNIVVGYKENGTGATKTSNMARLDGQAVETWIVPADGKWHYYRGAPHIWPSTVTASEVQYIRSYAYSRDNSIGDKFSYALPKVERGKFATPWLPYSTEIKSGHYPTYRGELIDDAFNDSDTVTDYTWSKMTAPDAVDFHDQNHVDVKDALLHTAYSWSADGKDRFSNISPNPNLFNEADLTTGYLLTSGTTAGAINSTNITANHQSTKTLEPIDPSHTRLTLTIYNSLKKAQATTNTNRSAFFDANQKFITYFDTPHLDGSEVQSITRDIPRNAKYIRFGVIHGTGTTKETGITFKAEYGEVATPFIPYHKAVRNHNLISGTGTNDVLKPTSLGYTYGAELSFQGASLSDFAKAGDKMVLSATWSVTDTANKFSGLLGAVLYGKKDGADTEVAISTTTIDATHKSGTLKYVYTVPADVLQGDDNLLGIKFLTATVPTTSTVTISHAKFEIGDTPTVWNLSATEDHNLDLPTYIGRYLNHDSDDSDQPEDYAWTPLLNFTAEDYDDTDKGAIVQNELNVPNTPQSFYGIPGTNVTGPIKYAFTDAQTFADQHYKEGGIIYVEFDWKTDGQDKDLIGSFNPQWTDNPWGLQDKLHEPIFLSPDRKSGTFSVAVEVTKAVADPSGQIATEFGFRMDNMSDKALITINNLKVQYYPPFVKRAHNAYAWSADGSDRFTTTFPAPNLIRNTIFDGAAVEGADSGLTWDFDNGGFADQQLDVGDVLTCSFVWSVTDTAGQFAGRFRPYFPMSPGEIFMDYVTLAKPASGNSVGGSYDGNVVITQDMLDGGIATQLGIQFDGMDGSETVAINNIKLESFGHDEIGYGVNKTPWMPSQSELDANDALITPPPDDGSGTTTTTTRSPNYKEYWPTYVGTYTDDLVLDSPDKTKYTWTTLDDPSTELTNQNIGDVTRTDGTGISPYRIIYNDSTIYQADYSRSASFLNIQNDSLYFGTQDDSSLRIVIRATTETGAIVNPHWYLTNQAGIKLQTEGFNTTIPVGFELVVSSDLFERTMILRDSSGELPDAEVDDLMDPTVSGWIRVPMGGSRIILENDLYTATGGFNGGHITAEYKKEWLVV